MRRLALLGLGLAAAALLPAQAPDPILQAMRDELSRSLVLKMPGLEPPYYIEYALDDGENFTASATLGGLLSRRHDRYRMPEISVRVGDYKFDNTNYAGGGFMGGSRYDVNRFPLEAVYPVLRRYLWLATDSAYKAAVETLSRKRAALRNITEAERLNDFSRVEPVKLVLASPPAVVDEESWAERLRSLSTIFAEYPRLRNSVVDVESIHSTHYMANTEGTEVRIPENLMFVRARATAQASDGMMVRDYAVFHSLDPAHIALEPAIRRAFTRLAENVSALAGAARGEMYSGPVLFESVAAAQLFAEVLGRNLHVSRRPVMEPGRPGMFPYSELEGRFGARILPEFMEVADDPTQSEWHGTPLIGAYAIDREGVIPKPLTLVEKGVLKQFLLTRQPVRGFEGSNGRARMPGSFGADTAAFGNLFVQASESVPVADLKKKMLDICQIRNKPYGLIVRKMDFPSSASFEEVRRLLAASAQGGGSHPVSMPLLVYKLYRDGREELVRGLRFRGLNARSFKDILAAGDDPSVFDFLDNPAPFALMGAGGFVSPSSVVAPSVLIDDLELYPIEDESPKLPLVPPPVGAE